MRQVLRAGRRRRAADAAAQRAGRQLHPADAESCPHAPAVIPKPRAADDALAGARVARAVQRQRDRQPLLLPPPQSHAGPRRPVVLHGAHRAHFLPQARRHPPPRDGGCLPLLFPVDSAARGGDGGAGLPPRERDAAAGGDGARGREAVLPVRGHAAERDAHHHDRSARHAWACESGLSGSGRPAGLQPADDGGDGRREGARRRRLPGGLSGGGDAVRHVRPLRRRGGGGPQAGAADGGGAAGAGEEAAEDPAADQPDVCRHDGVREGHDAGVWKDEVRCLLQLARDRRSEVFVET